MDDNLPGMANLQPNNPTVIGPAPAVETPSLDEPAAAAVEPAFSFGKVTVEETSSGRGWLKLALFLTIILLIGIGATVGVTQLLTTSVYRASKGVLISTPFKTTVWQSYGSVPEAEIEVPIQTPQGIVKQLFLLDTGAVVSSLPREMAESLGFNLAFLPRQAFRGFGNTTSFAYSAEMNVVLGTQQIKLPVVFTEAQGSKSLLGRKGLFDKFTIIVDHNSQLVEIRE